MVEPHFLILIVCVSVISLLIIGLFLGKLYHRSTKEMAFVRTGFGGQKVIYDGGALVFPVLHTIVGVNMLTRRLSVIRKDGQALITKDKMRVDVAAEFFVRVKPTKESIADAAQTLGKRTMKAAELAEHVEAKFVDALRSVAAEMEMEELHEQRVNFVQKVQIAVSEDLLKNGLELETVSLTSLDQTKKEFFNPQNVFDAEGLTKLTGEIEIRRKKRNDIERTTQVEIQKKDLETEQITLKQKKEEENAKLIQKREIEARRAEEAAEIVRIQSENRQHSEEAQLQAEEQINRAIIQSEQKVKQEKIEQNRILQQAEIEREKKIKIADQDSEIATLNKSIEQSQAKVHAEENRLTAVRAMEKVNTEQQVEIAERDKQTALIEIRKKAEGEAIIVQLAAEAEKHASVEKALAIIKTAEAEADRTRIVGQGNADTKKLIAEAVKIEAESVAALNKAENTLSPELIQMKIKQETIAALPNIITASVKPIESISDIKIMHIGGLTGNSCNDGNGNGSSDKSSITDQVVNSALRYRGVAPLLDAVLKEVGISGANLQDMTELAKKAFGQSNGSADNI